MSPRIIAWAFQQSLLTLATLGGFVLLQSREWWQTYDPVLLFLTVLDIVVIGIVILEIRQTRHKRQRRPA